MKIWPHSKLGKWGAGLSLAFIILIFLKMAQPLPIQVRLPLPTPVLALFGFAGFITALIAIIKDRERALLVWLAILVGLVIIFWTTAEIMFPH